MGAFVLFLPLALFTWLIFTWTRAASRIGPVRAPDSGGRARSFLRASAIDLGMLGGIGGTLVLVAMGVWDSMQYKGQEPPRDFDEPVAWQKLESAVAEVTPVFADFEGFASRSVEVKPCAGM